MADLSESSTWEPGIYQLEVNDPVDAGINGAGVANRQAKELANRTVYLRDAVDDLDDLTAAQGIAISNIQTEIGIGGRKFRDVVDIGVDTVLQASHQSTIIRATAAGIIITVPDFGYVTNGNVFAIWNNSTGNIQVVGGGPGNNILPSGDLTLEPGDFMEMSNFGFNYILTNLNKNRDRVPVGTVQAFALSSPPDGWLACNGAETSGAIYPVLFALLGTMFDYLGTPTPGNFRVPDLRGEFVRGIDNGRGIDSGRVLGSEQSEAVNSGGTQMRGSSALWSSGAATGNTQVYFGNSNNPTYGTSIIVFGGSETRPRNVALMYCIKY